MRVLIFALLFCISPLHAAESYHDSLKALIDGRKTPLPVQLENILALHKDNLSEGLLGVSFGMTMQEVIDVWGRPTGICVKHNNIELKIYRSYFAFVNNQLMGVRVSTVDFPDLELAGGKLKMSDANADLNQIFPQAHVLQATSSSQKVELADQTMVRILRGRGKLTSIEVSKPH